MSVKAGGPGDQIVVVYHISFWLYWEIMLFLSFRHEHWGKPGAWTTNVNVADTKRINCMHTLLGLYCISSKEIWWIYSLSGNIFPGTGLNPAQGPRGKRPELRNQLTSRDASSKRPRLLGCLPQRGLKHPWPEFHVTRVIALGPGSPLSYIINTTLPPPPGEFGIRRAK